MTIPRVWVVICGYDWPRQVERVYQTEATARKYADKMNGSVKIATPLYWIEEWAVFE